MTAYSKGQFMLQSGSSGSSPDMFVGDCRLLTLSIQTSTGSASNVTVLGSNDHGFSQAIGAGSYSVLTVISRPGLFTIDPGFRWMRVDRADIAISAASNTTVVLNRYFE